jgi:hypothetical protein
MSWVIFFVHLPSLWVLEFSPLGVSSEKVELNFGFVSDIGGAIRVPEGT